MKKRTGLIALLLGLGLTFNSYSQTTKNVIDSLLNRGIEYASTIDTIIGQELCSYGVIKNDSTSDILVTEGGFNPDLRTYFLDLRADGKLDTVYIDKCKINKKNINKEGWNFFKISKYRGKVLKHLLSPVMNKKRAKESKQHYLF